VGDFNWEYDSSTTGGWTNETGPANNASAWGNVTTTNTAGIGCFYATNGGFDIGGAGTWWTSTSFTIQAWMYLHGYNSTNTGIITQYSGGGRHNWHWNSTSSRLHINGCKGAWTGGNSGGTGTWRLLTLRYNNGYTYTVDDHLHTATSHTGSGNMCTSSTNICIGARDDHVEPAHYSVRKVMFYDRALTDAEVTNNWNVYKANVGR